MNRDQAQDAYRQMVAAWPSPAHSDDTARMWFTEMCRARLDVARLVVPELIHSLDRFPTVAQWHEAARSAVRRLDVTSPAPLPSGDQIPPPARHAALLAEARAALRAAP